MLRNRILTIVIASHVLQCLILFFLHGDLLRWAVPTYIQRPLWSSLMLIALSCFVNLYLCKKNVIHEVSPSSATFFTTVVPMIFAIVILFLLWETDRIFTFLVIILISVPSYLVFIYFIKHTSSIHPLHNLISSAGKILPAILMGICTFIYFRHNHKQEWAIPLFITSLFLYSSLFIFVCSLITKKNNERAVLKSVLLIPLSIMMFYFSGQNIGMLNGAGTPADNGQIWENFDNIYFRQTTILDYSLVENRTPSAFGLVAFGQVIYRDPLKTDPIPLGSYTNHFFFREYYLSKNCKMIFLRGFGILFNLPDDDKYLLKN